jgi:hypothetical protein
MTDFRLWFDDHSHWLFIGATVAILFGGSIAITLSLTGVH